MSIRKDLVIKITKDSASLDMPLQIYEKDHGIELRFKLMNYKYKYDKDPDNVLNSNKEDILEAYTTIINPSGYELTQINGEVVEDTIKFMIEDSYTDELEELGIYRLQIHVKCEHSEFSIPPVQFEVLERLKGIPLYAQVDEGIVDYSTASDEVEVIDIVDGKLQLVWQSGEIITSTRLNAMVNYANSLYDEINELSSEVDTNIATKLQEQDTKLQQLETNINTTMNESISAINADIDTINAQQETQDQKITNIETNYVLKNELEASAIQVEGSAISCDSTEGYAQNVEILGNTIQNQNDLADIRSVGEDVEGQELYKIDVISTIGTNENLFDIKDYKKGGCYTKNGFSPSNHCYYSDKFINVKPNTTYHYFGRNGEYKPISYTVFYDENKNTIIEINNKTSTTSPSNARYMRVSPWKDVIETDNPLDYIGEEEKNIQYQEGILTILSPVQLEKVGDVADRIICKDGVWGVEKNIKTITYTDDIDWFVSGQSLCMNPNLDFDKSISNADIVMSMLLSNQIVQREHHLYNGTHYGIGYKPATDTIRVRLEGINSKEELNTYIKTNPIVLKYQTAQPQFIPLPHDQQIKLRTFAGRTNISFLTEIKGTIKAQIPQSLGSKINMHTEQIDNLGKELDKVKKLEESTVSTITTDNDFTCVENTSNGYFEDVKLEGRTLVNLYPKLDAKNYEELSGIISDDTITINADGNWHNFKLKKDVLQLKASTYYTFVIDIIENTLEGNDNFPLHFGETLESDPSKFSDEYLPFIQNKKGIYTFKLKTKDSFDNINNDTRDFLSNTVTSGTIVFKYMILEGDHTQNPPSYFEGLKSAGQDVEEVSILSSNKGSLSSISEHNFGTNGRAVSHTLIEPIKPGEKFKICYTNNSTNSREVGVKFRYANGEVRIAAFGSKGFNSAIYTNNTNSLLPIIELYRDSSYDGLYITNISITRVKNDNDLDYVDYQHYQSNKKPLLYYNPTTQTWEKPVLREWDSIEKHSDGKYYYHKRSKEMVLNGSEDWGESGVDHSKKDMMRFYINTDAMPTPYKVAGPIISDKFATSPFDAMYDQNTEGVSITIDSELGLGIFKSRLSTVGVVGLKAWLQANPTTVAYQLKTEEVYECINIDLMTYENETNYIVNTGAIVPLSTLKVMCNITNVVRELQQKVSNLENYIQYVMLDALNNALNE